MTYQTIWTVGELKISNITLTMPTADAAAIGAPEAQTVIAA